MRTYPRARAPRVHDPRRWTPRANAATLSTLPQYPPEMPRPSQPRLTARMPSFRPGGAIHPAGARQPSPQPIWADPRHALAPDTPTHPPLGAASPPAPGSSARPPCAFPICLLAFPLAQARLCAPSCCPALKARPRALCSSAPPPPWGQGKRKSAPPLPGWLGSVRERVPVAAPPAQHRPLKTTHDNSRGVSKGLL
ncbi:MAG: hypothetical protein J3K34DRAFT_374327 [Monoraphidium minutum]|nr:MAG: hypothetical protein J3K34DRAFT_374327 [Monoraphidium minutum]